MTAHLASKTCTFSKDHQTILVDVETPKLVLFKNVQVLSDEQGTVAEEVALKRALEEPDEIDEGVPPSPTSDSLEQQAQQPTSKAKRWAGSRKLNLGRTIKFALANVTEILSSPGLYGDPTWLLSDHCQRLRDAFTDYLKGNINEIQVALIMHTP